MTNEPLRNIQRVWNEIRDGTQSYNCKKMSILKPNLVLYRGKAVR